MARRSNEREAARARAEGETALDAPGLEAEEHGEPLFILEAGPEFPRPGAGRRKALGEEREGRRPEEGAEEPGGAHTG